jgi:LysM domain
MFIDRLVEMLVCVSAKIVRAIPLVTMGFALAACSANARFDMWEYRVDPSTAATNQLGAKPAEGMKPAQPTQSWGPARSGAEHQQNSRFVYVADGDTLESIAAKYQVSVDGLVATNGLSSRALSPGQYLMLPAPGPGKTG